MRYLFVLMLGMWMLPLSAQDVRPLKGIVPTEDYDNVKVIPVYSDADASTFVIYIKEGVGIHYHAEHTEQLVVLAGKGVMTLGGETIPIRKGDFIMIPRNVHHSVRVTSRKPLKVLSVQAPEFKGKDRIFLD